MTPNYVGDDGNGYGGDDDCDGRGRKITILTEFQQQH